MRSMYVTIPEENTKFRLYSPFLLTKIKWALKKSKILDVEVQ